jgi:hypothetical protein
MSLSSHYHPIGYRGEREPQLSLAFLKKEKTKKKKKERKKRERKKNKQTKQTLYIVFLYGLNY